MPYKADSIPSTLLERLFWRATYQRDCIAYRFLADQSSSVTLSDIEVWTYGDLHARVQVIAAELKRFDSLTGQPVLLVYSPGLELIAAFLACLSVGAIATLVPPPRRHESWIRWQHIMADADVVAVLTTEAIQQDIAPLLTRSVCKRDQNERSLPVVDWLATDTLEFSPDTSFNAALTTPEKVAFLQYTSGSTSQPKGVMVTHGNLAHNLQQIQAAFGQSDIQSADIQSDIAKPSSYEGVIWLPPYHDMGLIGGILQPLYGGYPVTLMSPTSFLRQPFRWLEAITRFGGTTSGGPNFAYDYCVQKISDEQCRQLDLSTWSLAFAGAEPIRAQTLARFAEKFASCGFNSRAFYPCYGLAESTLFVTGKEATASPTVISVDRVKLNQGEIKQVHETEQVSEEQAVQQVVSCGYTRDQQVKIVDPQAQSLCESGRVGEVWVSGESVAAGYWNKVAETKEAFENKIDGSDQQFLRTGDLGFIHSGELFITGRLKDLIVIRGQNYYPQDIELSLSHAHASLQPAAAAFSLDVKEIGKKDAHCEHEQLVVVQELSRTAIRQIRKNTLPVSEIFDAMRACISQQHGLQVWVIALLKPGHLPKTTSGKVQRQICKQKFKADTLEVVSQWERTTPQGESKQPGKQPITKPSSLGRDHDKTRQKTDQLLAWLQEYAKTSINSRVMDERRCLTPSIVLDFGNQGLLGMQVPQQYGGLGLSNRSMLRVLEQLGAIDPTLALFVGLNNVLGVRPIMQYAQQALKEELLPKLATGRELAAFALTESGAGSHPLGIASKAVPVEDDWQLSGKKIWSGSAAWAGVTNVFVQQVDASGVPVGISGFAVKKGSAGLKQGPEALTMGMRGMVQNTVLLEGVLVSDAERLGEPGKGMTVAQDAMMYGRLAIAAACVGGMKRCAQLMLRYSERRTISTGRLLDNPITMTRLNWLVNAIAATESLVTLTATRLDTEQSVPEQSVPEELYAACKIAAPEFYWQAADNLVQCLGGRGYIETNIAPQILRDARVLRIFEGPTESLAMYLGSRVVNQPQALKDFLDELALPKVGHSLFDAADLIVEKYAAEQHSDSYRKTGLRQAHYVIGKIATWTILLAALKATSDSADAIAWCQTTFEQAVKEALEPQPDESANLSSLIENIEGYPQSIGDIEQTLAGSDGELDKLLQLQSHPAASADAATITQASYVRANAESSSLEKIQRNGVTLSPTLIQKEKNIETWLIQWLSENLDLPSEHIDPNKAFADYGLDSVTGVELAQDLSDFLNVSEPLEATLAWSFPTMRSLSRHLASMLAQPDLGQQEIDLADELIDDGLEGPNGIEEQSAFSDLSEDEAASALLAELATVRGR
ncbi:MAG: AMP-binding protein [Cyanobacteria bacterium J06632_3]